MELIRYGLCLLLASLTALSMAAEDIGANLPSPAQMYEQAEKEFMVPFSYEITKDTIVSSDLDADVKLRRIEFSFVSQIIQGEKIWHRGIIFLPTDKKFTNDPKRRGKAVIIGCGVMFQDTWTVNYAMPIVTRLGYPVMLLPIPGEGENNPGRGLNCGPMIEHARKTRRAIHYYFFRIACMYARGVDLYAAVLEVEKSDMRVIVGGHSKGAAGAYLAAAALPDNFAGVAYMGYETVTKPGRVSPFNAIRQRYTQKYVKCPVLYVGATNEDGYAMFNISKRQAFMKKPMTIAIVPNYKHDVWNEKQFIAWQMWTSHVFDNRPVTEINQLKHTETKKGTTFSANIDSPNKKLLVIAWYTYCDDEPYWRDLMWYPCMMWPREGNRYETGIQGKMPDAWMVEVLDVSHGVRGYVTSLPMQLGNKEVKERPGRNAMPRLWDPQK
jgi:dienelactone hydrolase